MAKEAEIKITVDSKQAERSLNKLDKSLKKTDGASKKSGKSMVALGRSMAAPTAAAAAAAVAFGALVKSAVAFGDSIGKTADKIGLSIAALQELRFAAEQSGVASNVLDMAMQRFVRRLGEADAGTGVLKKELIALGIATRDADGNMRSAEAVLGDYADGIANAESESEQLRLAFAAFDSEGAALVNLFRDGKIGVEELRQELRDLGGVMSDESVRGAEKLTDAFGRISAAIGVPFKEKLISAGISIHNFFADASNDIHVFAFTTLAQADAEIAAIQTRIVAGQEKLAKAQERIGRTGKAAVSTATEQLAGMKNELDQATESADKLREALAPPSGDAPDRQAAEALKDQLALWTRLNPEISAYVATATDLRDGVEAGLITQEQMNIRLQEALDIYNATTPAGLAAAEAAKTAQKAEEERLNKLNELTAEQIALQGAVADTAGAMASSIVDFALTGEQSFGEMAEAIIKDLIKMIIQAQIFNALTGALGGTSLGTSMGIPPPTASANGNAFAGGNVIPFAKGGVISGPTMAPMALMGEAGPEAVLPLQRGKGGKLGVVAQGGGGGGGVTVNVVNNQPDSEVDVKTSPDGMTIDVMIEQKVNQGLGNGAFDKSLNSSFGLSRKGF